MEKKKRLRRLFKRTQYQNVHFIDFCDKEKVFEYYKMSDVFFFPSREDIWGLVINEAMSCGLPVIATFETASAREVFKKVNFTNVIIFVHFLKK